MIFNSYLCIIPTPKVLPRGTGKGSPKCWTMEALTSRLSRKKGDTYMEKAFIMRFVL